MKVPHHGAMVSDVARDKSHKDSDVKGAHGQAVSEVARSKSPAQQAKAMGDAAILAAHEKVTLNSGDDSMALLYRSAIEAINEELAPALGDNVIQRNFEEKVDTSPEATAGRIVDFATQFFTKYQEQNSNLSLEEQVDGFLSLIGDAVDVGFADAKEVLDGLNVLEGDIATGVEKTYSLVQDGLAAFRDKLLSPEPTEAEASQPENVVDSGDGE